MEKEQNIYLRKNGENLSDPDIIALCKLEQNRDIIENTRLGSYDNFGNYVFLPDIRFELINIPKFIYHFSETQDKKVFDLKTTIPIFGELFFTLTISQNEAVLYLVETVTRELGNYVEVYEEVIDALALGKMNALKTEDIFAIFHIYENDDDQNQQDETFFIFEYQNILVRKIYLSLLSKELLEATQEEESDIFAEMITFLKDGGDYGKTVLDMFMLRLKERPEIFEIDSSEKYKKAVNEVLLSALDMATTPQDKENFHTKEVYLKVLNARNKDVEKQLENAHKKIDKDYVLTVATSAVKDHNLSKLTQNEKTKDSSQQIKENASELASNRNIVREFYDRLILKKTLSKSAINQKVASKMESKSIIFPAAKTDDKKTLDTAKKPLVAVDTATKIILSTPSQTLKKASPQKPLIKKSSSSPKPKAIKKSSSSSQSNFAKKSNSSSKSNSIKKFSSSPKPRTVKKSSSSPKPNANKKIVKTPPKPIIKQPESPKPTIIKNTSSSSKSETKKPKTGEKREDRIKNQSSSTSQTQKSEAKKESFYIPFSKLGVIGAAYSASQNPTTQTSSIPKESAPIKTPDINERNVTKQESPSPAQTPKKISIVEASKTASPTQTPKITSPAQVPRTPSPSPQGLDIIQTRAERSSQRHSKEIKLHSQAGKVQVPDENQLKTPVENLSGQEGLRKESIISEELTKSQTQNPALEEEFNLTH